MTTQMFAALISRASQGFESLAFVLIGTLVGAVAAHLLTKNRDAENRLSLLRREADLRRRTFRKNLIRFRHCLERESHNRPEDVWACYVKEAPILLAEAESIRGDFSRSEVFELAIKAGSWRREDADAEARRRAITLRDVLCDALRGLYEKASADNSPP